MLRDLLGEAATAISARPSRSIFTAIGTILGVGSLVTVLGLAATVRGQVGDRFDAIAATTVTVTDLRADPAIPFPFTAQAETNVRLLNGVVGVGRLWPVQPSADSNLEMRPRFAAEAASGSVFAASPGLWDVVEPTFAQGRGFDDFHEQAGSDVVVLGSSLAASMDLTTLSGEPAVLIGNRPYIVIGILQSVNRRSDLLLSAILPAHSTIRRWGPPQPESSGNTLLIRTRPGAAQQVAGEAQLAISPTDPTMLRAEPPPDPRSLRESVDQDLTALLLALTAMCLLIGGVGIGNTTLVAVLERTSEFGLRRALGATRRQIVLQVLIESSLLGLTGALVGTGLAVLTILTVAIAQAWTPVLSTGLVIAAPAIGLLIGALAGSYPAWRAGLTEPSEALRR